MTENKKVKDNLFVDLFCSDQDGTWNFLSLYNALHNTNLKFDEVKIEPKRIEQVMYRTLSNDVAMEINDKLIVMVEQQSTINKNMPLRFVMYISRLYESFVEEKDKYRRTLVEIPTPEFYVIYNGQDNYPKESILQLSDAFKDKSIDIQLDLKVTVYNVNKYRDLDIVQQCRAMNDYCKFIDLINYEKSNGVKTDRYSNYATKPSPFLESILEECDFSGLQEVVDNCIKDLKENYEQILIKVISSMISESLFNTHNFKFAVESVVCDELNRRHNDGCL